MAHPINSEAYWEERFGSGDWAENHGDLQTAYFYRLLLKLMPDWAKKNIRENGYSMVDFGCATGEGVPIVASELGDNIRGMDFSESAIRKARASFPKFAFDVADVWKYETERDVAIVSNIIEHFDVPFELLAHIAEKTREYMVVMIPLEETELMDEHRFTFVYNNIPIAIRDFQLIYFEEYDCRDDEEQLFLAKQIFLLYSRNEAVNQSLSIEAANGLYRLLVAKHGEQALAGEKLSSLRRQLLETEGHLWEKIENHANLLESEILAVDLRLKEGLVSSGIEMQNALNAQTDLLTERMQTMQKNIEALIREKDQNRVLVAENERLTALFNETNTNYLDLVARFNALNDAYAFVNAENAAIRVSRTYRAANLIRRVARKLRLVGPARFVLTARRQGIKEAIRQRKLAKQGMAEPVSVPVLVDPSVSELSPEDRAQAEAYAFRQNLYRETLASPMSDAAREIEAILSSRTYKGIVVYPHAVHWEPVQRPQHLLRAFARSGYLTFFCEVSEAGKVVEEKYENVFVVYGEENLLWPLSDKCPLLMITYHMQMAFADVLRKKSVWFDLLDNLEFFSGGGSALAAGIYESLISTAPVVSYSSDNLKNYLPGRDDALKLNNGVMLQDFEGAGDVLLAPEMQKIRARGKKIAGYYGAIEEWFDLSAIRSLLEKTDLEIVLIGRVGIELGDLKKNARVHVLGAVPYRELPSYACAFDLALIPFIKNKLTDSVSPVKFYEYVAQGLPVLSSDIQEMRQYAAEQVRIYRNEEELLAGALALSSGEPDRAALLEIARKNTWESRADAVMEALAKDAKELSIFADFKTKSPAAVETVTFFKYDGSTYYSGGAERYLLDLQEVLSEMNVPYRVYQYGEYNWVRFYNEVEVMGMRAKENDVNLYCPALIGEMSGEFSREIQPSARLAICSPFYILGNAPGHVPTVGISHGISWDSENNHYTDGNLFWQINKNIIDSAAACDRMISVDTNTCNWFQTLDYDVGRKIRYIPNYVDNEEFSPREDYLAEREKVVITYPRRLYGARGLYVVLDVIDDILEKYPNVEFHFVGKGFSQDTRHVEKKMAKWPGRVLWYSKAPAEMHEVYKDADISLVPTMYSEGTSLSCLEALSSGNVVIATRVGGLTDLILSDFNGKLVEPTGESIKTALFDLLDHPEKMRELKLRGRETALAFSKKKWKEAWKEFLAPYAAPVSSTPEKAVRTRILVKDAAALTSPETLSLVRERLCKGEYVFVACPQNPLRLASYKRLQFIDPEEDLYFTPENNLDLTK